MIGGKNLALIYQKYQNLQLVPTMLQKMVWHTHKGEAVVPKNSMHQNFLEKLVMKCTKLDELIETIEEKI